MNIKKNLQFFLFLFLIISSFIFFKKYISNDKNNIALDDQSNYEENIKAPIKSNIIYNIEYTSLDKEGNNFNIKSKLGTIKDNDSSTILMEIVEATIVLNKKDIVKIYANNAIYNSQTLDTNFFESVVITYDENEIKSDNVDLLFQKKLLTISNNVFYKNLNTNLLADKVHIDLMTKDVKISMKNKSKNVKIKNIN